MVRLGIDGCDRPRLKRRMRLWVAVAWLPPFVLAGIGALMSPDAPQVTIFNDLPFHVRCLVAVPILFLAECHVARHLSRILPVLTARQMIRDESKPAFSKLESRIRNFKNSTGAEIFLLLASFSFVASRFYLQFPEEISTWRQIDSTLFVLARAWNRWIGLTLYYFLLVRWVWRFLLWCYFLLGLARLKPVLESHHPDRVGGLSFLVHRHLRFGLAALALSTVISAKIAEIVIFSGIQVEAFVAPVAIYLVTVQVLHFMPLLVFTPLLLATRRKGLDEYGTFANRYSRDFDRRWLTHDLGGTPGPLGTPDLQSLNDLIGSYTHLREMSFFVVNRKHIMALAFLTSLPLLPLTLFKIPAKELLAMVAKMVV